MIATETGPQLLEKGILIRGRILARFLDRQAERILPVIERAEVDNAAVIPLELAAMVKGSDLVFLKLYG